MFITRKSYICSRRLHQILAPAIAILHFREFDSRFNNENFTIINDEPKLTKEEKKIDLKCFSKEATEVLDENLV